MDFPISFETKDFIGVAVMFIAFFAATLALFVSARLREIALFLIVGGPILTHGLDINFFGADWYRGTTRGFETTFVDILAAALFVCVLMDPRERKPYWPAGLAPMLLFVMWAAVTVGVMQPWIFGSYELHKMIRGLLIFLVVAYYVRDQRRIYIVIYGLATAVIIQALWGMHQWYIGVYRVTGTLDHSNSLSMYLCFVTPVLAAVAASIRPPTLLRWICGLATAVAVPTILLTLSRAGMPVFTLVVGGSILGCISWRPTLGKVAFAGIGFVVIIGLVSQSWEQISIRYGQATLSGEYFDEGSEGRGYYFRQAKVILKNRPFGVGLNNWSYIVSKEFSSGRGLRYDDYDYLSGISGRKIEVNPGAFAPPAHNLGLITLGEMGWVGLFLFTIAWIRWFQLGISNQKGPEQKRIRYLSFGILMGLLGIFLQSLTEWTFRQSEIFMTFSVLIGVLAALNHARKNPSVSIVETDSEQPIENL